MKKGRSYERPFSITRLTSKKAFSATGLRRIWYVKHTSQIVCSGKVFMVRIFYSFKAFTVEARW